MRAVLQVRHEHLGAIATSRPALSRSPTPTSASMYEVATRRLVSHHRPLVDGRFEGVSVSSATCALRARLDGAPGLDAAARALGRLGAGDVHERQIQPVSV
jgi:hypothetical protein